VEDILAAYSTKCLLRNRRPSSAANLCSSHPRISSGGRASKVGHGVNALKDAFYLPDQSVAVPPRLQFLPNPPQKSFI